MNHAARETNLLVSFLPRMSLLRSFSRSVTLLPGVGSKHHLDVMILHMTPDMGCLPIAIRRFSVRAASSALSAPKAVPSAAILGWIQ